MTQIVDNQFQYERFLERWNTESVFFKLIFSDVYKHPRNNRISLIFVKFLNNNDDYLVLFNHCEANESLNFESLCNSNQIRFTVNAKEAFHFGLKSVDLSLRMFNDTHEPLNYVEFNTSAHDHYQQTYWYNDNVNDVIPAFSHKQYCLAIFDTVSHYIDVESNDVNDIEIPKLLSFMERDGIAVDLKTWVGKEKHSNNGITYCDYNVFTSTTRPSNSHAGVNFAALNKNDGTRNSIVSRYGNQGRLVQFDYDAYHLRLMAELVGFSDELPNTSLHEWIGKSHMSDEEYSYNKSKQYNFQQLYGNVNDITNRSVSFFRRINTFKESLWESSNRNGFYDVDWFGKHRFETKYFDGNTGKFFNYIIQCLETQRNFRVIKTLSEMNLESKFVLYTYDSFLFDVHVSNIEEVRSIRNVLEDGKYPTKLEVGHHYGDMN